METTKNKINELINELEAKRFYLSMKDRWDKCGLRTGQSVAGRAADAETEGVLRQ